MKKTARDESSSGGFFRLLPLGGPVWLHTSRPLVTKLDRGCNYSWKFEALCRTENPRDRIFNLAGSPSLAKTYRDGPHPDNARIEVEALQSIGAAYSVDANLSSHWTQSAVMTPLSVGFSRD